MFKWSLVAAWACSWARLVVSVSSFCWMSVRRQIVKYRIDGDISGEGGPPIELPWEFGLLWLSLRMAASVEGGMPCWNAVIMLIWEGSCAGNVIGGRPTRW